MIKRWPLLPLGCAKAGGVRFSEEPPSSAGPSSHVHFDDKLHDSVVMVTPEDDGNFMVKVCLCVYHPPPTPFRPIPRPSGLTFILIPPPRCFVLDFYLLESVLFTSTLSVWLSVRSCSPPVVCFVLKLFLCSDNLTLVSCLCLSRMWLIQQLLCQRDGSAGHGGFRLVWPADSPSDLSSFITLFVFYSHLFLQINQQISVSSGETWEDQETRVPLLWLRRVFQCTRHDSGLLLIGVKTLCRICWELSS